MHINKGGNHEKKVAKIPGLKAFWSAVFLGTAKWGVIIGMNGRKLTVVVLESRSVHYARSTFLCV